MSKLSGGIDVGSNSHHVIVMNEKGEILYDDRVLHRINEFYKVIEKFKEMEKEENGKISFAVEGKSGYSAPFDRILIENGYSLYNIDNLKLKRFREVFGAEWRNDKRDAKMLARMMKLKENLDAEGEKVFIPINKNPLTNEKLKILSRHQKTLIDEKVRLQSRLTKKLLEVAPGILDMGNVDDKKLLRILVRYPDFSKYRNIKEKDLLKIKGIGDKNCKSLTETLKKLEYIEELADVYSTIILSCAKRILELKEEIEELDKKLDNVGSGSKEVKCLKTIPGVATKLASRLVGEIGDIKRFEDESALAVYCGVACLDDDSGKIEKTKVVFKANKICKSTMVDIAGCTIRYITESKIYYDKKRAEGKKHNHALRCLARQLIKMVFKLLIENREYVIRESLKKAT